MLETMSPRVKAALDECRGMITKGSKSFSLAARLFDSETRDAAFFLYGWCRYCDDQVDQAGMEESREQLEQRLRTLAEATRSAFSGAAQEQAVFIAMQYIVRRYSIPAHYALELIEGMAMDARATRYHTFNDLLLYCYRVAGTVGLMMSRCSLPTSRGISPKTQRWEEFIYRYNGLKKQAWFRKKSQRQKIARSWRWLRADSFGKLNDIMSRETPACGTYRFVPLALSPRRVMSMLQSVRFCCLKGLPLGTSGPMLQARKK
jgi:hypothetical protein